MMAMSQHPDRLSRMVATRTEVRSRRGVVSAGHPLAVQAGLEALDAGGNAIDAVVAGAFASFVAEPNNAGVAGYGHLSAFLASDGQFLTVDHGPRAPLAATPDMFEVDPSSSPEGYDWPEVVGRRNDVGHLAPAVPGAVSGLWAAHQRAGRLAWARLLEPAIAIAEQGLEVTWLLLLEIAAKLEEIRESPALAAMLLPEGRLPRAATPDSRGDALEQRELAQTLRSIAEQGPVAFYEGPVAAAIAREIRAGGGIMSEEDLARYAPKLLHEQPARYRDLDYVTANDQVGYEALNILARFGLGELGPGSAEHLHLLAEAMGHAFADNITYYGDPDHAASPVAGLASPAFAAMRAEGIRLDAAAARPVETADPWPFDPASGAGAPAPPPSVGGARGTTQVVAADAEGNLVSLITTIGGDFGSVVAVPDTGIVLNNSMMNYDPRPGRSNSIAPGKMPFFAVPAIVAAREGRAAFAAAGSGGYPILAGVLNTMVNAVDHGLDIQAAVDAPRVHSQGQRTYIDARVPDHVRERLAAMGHELVVQAVTPGELPFSRVSAIRVDDGVLTAGSGPAWNTAAGGL
jgi:gamma-glutamyltranspeptidase / glutathione hydrolase